MCEEWWWKRCVNRRVVVGKYISWGGGGALHGADGYAEKAGSEKKGGGSLRGEKMSGRTACFGAGGAGFFPVGEKRQPFCRRMARSSAERIQGYGWVEERTACKEKPHTAIRVRQNSFEKHFPKCP